MLIPDPVSFGRLCLVVKGVLMRILITALVFWLAVAQSYAQTSELLKFVDRFDVCVTNVTSLIATSLQDSIVVFAVTDGKTDFDAELTFEQPLSRLPKDEQTPPFFLGANCGTKFAKLTLADVTVSDVVDIGGVGSVEILHEAVFGMNSGYWAIQVRAWKDGLDSVYSKPDFIRVTYEQDPLAPRAPVRVLFKIKIEG